MGKKSKPKQQKKAQRQQVKQKPQHKWLKYVPAALLSLIMLIAFLLRVLPQISKVFVDGTVWFRGVDSWYHMRLADSMMINWPLPMSQDMYAAYPNGSTVGFYPLMGWTITTLGKIGLNYEMVGAFLPPVLGMLTLIPVYFLGRELFNKKVALFGCLLVAILPTEFLHRSLLGFTDQHIMETFLMACIIMFLVLAFKRERHRLLFTIGAGISLGFYFLNWHGSAFLVALLGVAVLAEIFYKYSKNEPIGHICKTVVIATAIGLLLATPYLIGAFGHNMTYLASILVIVGLAGLWGLTRIISRKKLLYVAVGSIAVLGLIALELLTPVLLQDSNAHIWRLITPAVWGVGAWIGEAQPLHPSIAFSLFGMSFFLFFIGLVYAVKRRVSPFFIVLSILLVLATIGQRRWGYYSVIPISLITSFFIFEAASWIKSEARTAVVIVLCIFTIIPSIKSISAIASMPNNIDQDWYQATTWLRENTPEPFGSDEYYTLNIEEKPEYSILSWWDYGHWIIRLGHRVPLTSPTNQGIQEESWFFVAQTEAEANEAIARLNIKYVIVDGTMPTGKFYAIVQKARFTLDDIEELWPESMVMRLWNEETESWVKVYEAGNVKIFERDPSKYENLEFIERYADVSLESHGHAQGVFVDGEYIWYSSNNMLKKTYLNQQDWNSPLAVNDHARIDGTEVDQINGITLHDDYIYATAPIFLEEPYRCFVKWYNKDTLEFVDEVEIFWEGGGSTQEGIAYHDSYWWTVYFDRTAVSQYDMNWNYVDSFDIEGTQGQGLHWVDDQLWVSVNRGNVRVYTWDGTNLNYTKVISRPSQMEYNQGLCKEPDTNTVWFAEFYTDADNVVHNNLVKTIVVKE